MGTGLAHSAGSFCLQAVGCDRQLGSQAKEDSCGVCAGDGSTCRLVRGQAHVSPQKSRSESSCLLERRLGAERGPHMYIQTPDRLAKAEVGKHWCFLNKLLLRQGLGQGRKVRKLLVCPEVSVRGMPHLQLGWGTTVPPEVEVFRTFHLTVTYSTPVTHLNPSIPQRQRAKLTS